MYGNADQAASTDFNVLTSMRNALNFFFLCFNRKNTKPINNLL